MTSAASAAEKTTVVLGTATPGGGFPVYGEAFAKTINEQDPTLDVQPKNTKGSAENIPLLEAGQLDIALVQGESAQQAFSGTSRPPAKLLVLAAMYATPGLFVVRADQSYQTIEDLRGKRIAFGAKGSGLVVLARAVLDGLGLDMNTDFKAVPLDKAGDGPAMVLSGEVAALWGGGLGWPGFTAVAKAPAGARFIVPDAEGLDRIQAKYPFLKRLTLPANSYPGQTAPIDSVGSWSLILVRPDLPGDVAYRLAKALHKGQAALAERLPQARATTAANTVAASPGVGMIHPGVVRYLREIKLLPAP